MYLKAEPYNWPLGGDLRPENTALILIDMQHEFCSDKGIMAYSGCDISRIKAIIPNMQKLLKAAREVKGLTIVHTREGWKKDLSNLSELKLLDSQWRGAVIGEKGPMGRFFIEGEENFDTIPELYPIEGELVIDKPGTGAFTDTMLEKLLLVRGIKNVIVTGVTTDCCVNSTMREATDRGFHCTMVSDCTAALSDEYQKFFEEYVKTSINFCTLTNLENVLAWLDECKEEK